MRTWMRDNAADLLSRDQLLQQVSSNELDVIGSLQVTRIRKANLDAAARATADEASAAADRARRRPRLRHWRRNRWRRTRSAKDKPS